MTNGLAYYTLVLFTVAKGFIVTDTNGKHNEIAANINLLFLCWATFINVFYISVFAYMFGLFALI